MFYKPENGYKVFGLSLYIHTHTHNVHYTKARENVVDFPTQNLKLWHGKHHILTKQKNRTIRRGIYESYEAEV